MSCLFPSEHWYVAGGFLSLKGIPKVFSVEEGSDLAGEYFFEISGNISTELVLTTRAKWTLHNRHNQELGSVMVAEDIQLNEQTPAPVHLGSRRQPLPSSKLDFSYNCGNNSNMLPFALWALVHCKDLPSIKRHSKRVLIHWRTLRGHEKSFFQYQGQAAHSLFV